MTREQAEKVVSAYREHGSEYKAANALGVSRNTFHSQRMCASRLLASPEVLAAANAGGIENVANLSHFWHIVKDEHGNGYSLYVKNPLSGEAQSLSDLVRETLEETAHATAPKYPKRGKVKGERLLVVDLADVHFRKLCVATETGYTYDRSVARARVIEGTKALLDAASNYNIGRILYVLGNDALHTDNAQGTTTSGTRQDTDGSLFQAFKDAHLAFTDSIKLCAEVADVDLLHCMSNHDWTHGWMLSQAIAAYFSKHPNVHASEYNVSELHRKYYRYESNLLAFSHGDGAKEEKLYGAMVTEARSHISECKNLYWHLHHVHHKDRKSRGGEKPYLREKDHNGMTAVMSGNGLEEGSHVNIEYVRSPSPPDGWHDRNGYLNRQGVESFIYHPTDGQKVRLTEWF